MGIQDEILAALKDAVLMDNGNNRRAALRMGIPEPTLRNWLSGRRNPISDTLALALDSLGLRLNRDNLKTKDEREGSEAKGDLIKDEPPLSHFSQRRAITREEINLREENETLKRKISDLNACLAGSEAEAKTLREQISMLYSLLCGNKLNLTCKNINNCAAQQFVGSDIKEITKR